MQEITSYEPLKPVGIDSEENAAPLEVCDQVWYDPSYFVKRSLWRLYWKSILKEINPGCSLEGLMLTLKHQYFGHLMQRANSLEKTPILGKIESKRRRGQQRMRWLGDMTDSMDMSLSQLQLIVKDRDDCHAAVQEVTKSWAQLREWTKLGPIGYTGIVLI